MSEQTTKASLRILTPETNVDFVSRALCVKASTQHLKGELRSPRNPNSSRFEESLWIYESPLADSCEIDEHIGHILDLLEARNETFSEIRGRTSAIDIFCMFSSESGQGSAEFSAELLRRLAAQRVELILDLYPPN